VSARASCSSRRTRAASPTSSTTRRRSSAATRSSPPAAQAPVRRDARDDVRRAVREARGAAGRDARLLRPRVQLSNLKFAAHVEPQTRRCAPSGARRGASREAAASTGDDATPDGCRCRRRRGARDEPVRARWRRRARRAPRGEGPLLSGSGRLPELRPPARR
jgi:hypothetical protein